MVLKFDFIHTSDSYMTRMHPWIIKIEAEQNTDRYCTAHLATDPLRSIEGIELKLLLVYYYSRD
jgi:hypothetical protein